ncbi:hypothetical protein FGKAn22_21960 [Ferrigenium kumadai]|uniref:Cytochrome c n=1 Tax=Ferrigenium kumadai TaxID=1682490 RepID=A0AAN1W0I5_9PROT|nr:hypothetical protein [Ferrigenium kumadai]BBJ00504.1 hypothetical protein FGKAn22_21960 [Ferrigenium kumadai]
MNRKIFHFIWISALLSGSVLASQVTVDEDSMQLMDDRNKSLSSNIALKDASSAKEDARALAEMFADVETYFAQKGKGDAVDWSKQSRELSAEITRYVAANDFDHASQSAVTLSKTCKACHQIYKTED